MPEPRQTSRPAPKPKPKPKAALYEVGSVVVYDWPNSGPVNCIVTSKPDADGNVGLMVLNEHVRVNQDDVEEP